MKLIAGMDGSSAFSSLIQVLRLDDCPFQSTDNLIECLLRQLTHRRRITAPKIVEVAPL